MKYFILLLFLSPHSLATSTDCMGVTTTVIPLTVGEAKVHNIEFDIDVDEELPACPIVRVNSPLKSQDRPLIGAVVTLEGSEGFQGEYHLSQQKTEYDTSLSFFVVCKSTATNITMSIYYGQGCDGVIYNVKSPVTGLLSN